jgi:hypothetical protein
VRAVVVLVGKRAAGRGLPALPAPVCQSQCELLYLVFRRNSGIFFLEDRLLKKQNSLKTRDAETARRICHAKNEALRQRPSTSRSPALENEQVSSRFTERERALEFKRYLKSASGRAFAKKRL